MVKEEIRTAGEISYLTFENLHSSEVLHAFTLRRGGVSVAPYNTLNLGGHVGDEPAAVKKNRQLLAEALGYQGHHVVSGQQTHGIKIEQVVAGNRLSASGGAEIVLPDTDGLICLEPDVVLLAYAADCTILFFFDPQRRCIGLAHAGWRGAVAGMAPAMVEAMARLGCLRQNIRVALSPSIGPCCYQVGDNVAREVASHLARDVLLQGKDGFYLDLPGYHLRLLQEAGIMAKNIISSRYCTSCHQQHFFSYRFDGGRTGRMAGIISLTPSRKAII
ncbi:MAG: peptidoglycan editing factor PgeF [Dethiobacter sp.]|jgi:YfiH family protein|nr:peptidoglycan editing factor PgeF [Dethiobacter sp.]MBS3900271.1 peptidoglycan editing factor PgeF [Dethiobacter sp.]MBS3983508.1 peptidoglycan editing factor PgeF [Dethiobacter sp.]MCL4463401.1 peptidoglycan editing factor PgeF [Bacillota bacterium]MCL5992868.1 peptidoglycan editing factor PgeF [Bacillota bacterium]